MKVRDGYDPAIKDEMNATCLRLYHLLQWLHWISPEMELHWRNMQAIKRMSDFGMDLMTRNAPIMLLFLADNRIKENETDALILSYQTLLSAEILGIQTCYFGAIQNYLPYSRTFKKIQCLPKHRVVACGLLLGYPKTKYHLYMSRRKIIREIKA